MWRGWFVGRLMSKPGWLALTIPGDYLQVEAMKSRKQKWYTESLMRRAGRAEHVFYCGLHAIYVEDGNASVIASCKSFATTRDGCGLPKDMAIAVADLKPERLYFLANVCADGASQFCDYINSQPIKPFKVSGAFTVSAPAELVAK